MKDSKNGFSFNMFGTMQQDAAKQTNWSFYRKNKRKGKPQNNLSQKFGTVETTKKE